MFGFDFCHASLITYSSVTTAGDSSPENRDTNVPADDQARIEDHDIEVTNSRYPMPWQGAYSGSRPSMIIPTITPRWSADNTT